MGKTLISAAPSWIDVGRGVGSFGSMIQAHSEAERGKYIASQYRANALEVEGASHREDEEIQRQKRLLQSRAQALGAFQGGDTTDFGMQDVLADIEREGEFRSLNALYRGSSQAAGLRGQADASEHQGRQRRMAGFGYAANTWLKGTNTTPASLKGLYK